MRYAMRAHAYCGAFAALKLPRARRFSPESITDTFVFKFPREYQYHYFLAKGSWCGLYRWQNHHCRCPSMTCSTGSTSMLGTKPRIVPSVAVLLTLGFKVISKCWMMARRSLYTYCLWPPYSGLACHRYIVGRSSCRPLKEEVCIHIYAVYLLLQWSSMELCVCRPPLSRVIQLLGKKFLNLWCACVLVQSTVGVSSFRRTTPEYLLVVPRTRWHPPVKLPPRFIHSFSHACAHNIVTHSIVPVFIHFSLHPKLFIFVC